MSYYNGAPRTPFYTRLNQILNKLVKGKTIGIDATTLEANAALRGVTPARATKNS
jgi:hypothetical protein